MTPRSLALSEWQPRSTEFLLNSACNHLHGQMVLKERERELDLFDRSRTRLHLHSQTDKLDQLPANSAGNFQPQVSERRARTRMSANRTQMRALPKTLHFHRKKINVKRVNC